MAIPMEELKRRAAATRSRTGAYLKKKMESKQPAIDKPVSMPTTTKADKNKRTKTATTFNAEALRKAIGGRDIQAEFRKKMGDYKMVDVIDPQGDPTQVRDYQLGPLSYQGYTLASGKVDEGTTTGKGTATGTNKGNVTGTIVPDTTPPTTTVAQGSPQINKAQNYIDQLNAARKKQTLAALEKSRSSALSNLQAEKAGIQPRFADERNRVAAGSQRQARNFAEYMAARGGTRAGSAAQAEISRAGALQSNLGQLGRQETQAYADIGRRTSDIQNAYQSDVAAAEAGIQADQMKLLLEDYYRAQERGDKLTQLKIENEFRRAGLTGVLDGQQTLQARLGLGGLDLQREQFDYGQQRDLIGDQRYADETTYQREQDALAQQNLQEEKAYRSQQDTLENQQWWADYERRGQEFAASQNLNWAQLDQREQEMIADEAYRQEVLAQNQLEQQQPTQNEITAEYVSNLDQMPQENIEAFFKDEKANIIRDLGPSGYKFLVGLYIDDESVANDLLKEITNQ